MNDYPMAQNWVQEQLRSGLVIPAHPLALTKARHWDERRQQALTRYYHAAGAGGIAIGVHTTQFEIRSPEHRLFEPVVELARTTLAACDRARGRRSVLVGGICGRTRQAVQEARFLRQAGCDAGLLSLAAFPTDSEAALVAHCRTVAREIPLFGFYLQPAVGGRVLPLEFWRRFAEIPNVVAIKIAAFNRYQTLDVIRALAEVGRAGEIALYTGNDDNIVLDLLTEFSVGVDGKRVSQQIVGGLLGHWACWTSAAVKLLEHCRHERRRKSVSREMLTLSAQVTEANAALFDVAHAFRGCIAGIHEVLRRQGLLATTRCLDRSQRLSPGQSQELDRIYASYPALTDDAFVREHLHEWLR